MSINSLGFTHPGLTIDGLLSAEPHGSGCYTTFPASHWGSWDSSRQVETARDRKAAKNSWLAINHMHLSMKQSDLA